MGLALKGLKKIAYQKFLENFIRRLTIIILQANTQRAEPLDKCEIRKSYFKGILSIVFEIFLSNNVLVRSK